MILCYEGTPGSGKSYDAIVKIIDNLKLGRIVYTNINGIDDSTCREHIKLKAALDDYECVRRLVHLSDLEITQPFKNCKPGSLIVIDEVHKLINARGWNKVDKGSGSNTNQMFADWASTHRHGGYDIVLITQNLEKVDGQVRGLVEFTHRYKKNNYFGNLFEKQFLVKVYEEDSTKIIGKRTGFYDKGIFKCYKSYVSSDIKEMKIQANVNILKHPIFYSIPVLLLIFGYFFSKSSFVSGDWFGTKAQYNKKIAALPKPEPLAVPVALSDKMGSPGRFVLYERTIDSKGKMIKETNKVLKDNGKKVVPALKKVLVVPSRVSPGVVSSPIPVVTLPARNYQGYISSGDVLYVLIGNRKTSFQELKILYPDVDIVDGRLFLSGVTYSLGQTVPL